MNVKRILELADAIERAMVLPKDSIIIRHLLRDDDPARHEVPKFFAMDVVHEMCDCGTAGCVVGFAKALFPEHRGLRETLGITLGQADKITAPVNYWRRDLRSTKFHPRRAARMLRHLAATGKIDWEGAR